MSASGKKALIELIDKRLDKFVSLLRRLLVSDEPDIIHDARVYSRRLQQVIRVFSPARGGGKSRKLIRTLRKTRRCLGSCRNLDTAIELVGKRIRAANNDAIRAAWKEVQLYLQEKRTRELLRARRELKQYDMIAFIKRARSLFHSRHREKHAEVLIRKRVEESLTDWYDALDTATQKRGQDSFHAFRIAGKRLRYRLELLAAVRDDPSKSKIKALKQLQDEIGQWHDRQIMLQLAADSIAEPDLSTDHPDLNRTLRREMNSEHGRNDAAIARILKHGQRVRAAWTAKTRQSPRAKPE